MITENKATEFRREYVDDAMLRVTNAIREALLNVIIHWDYFFSDAALINIFYRLRLIEAYGTGILKINECYDDYTVKPVIETTDNAFKITLPNTNWVLLFATM